MAHSKKGIFIIKYINNISLDKMLFEGDLIYISEKGQPKKAGKRQAGLYNAIKDMKLDVTTIEQSWPVSGYGVKSEIPFTDMEAAMQAK